MFEPVEYDLGEMSGALIKVVGVGGGVLLAKWRGYYLLHQMRRASGVLGSTFSTRFSTLSGR